MAFRSLLARTGAAVLGIGVALLSVAPASAADLPKPGPLDTTLAAITGLVNDHKDVQGTSVTMDYEVGGHAIVQKVGTYLIGLDLSDHSHVQTYCIQLTVGLKSEIGMTEVGWDLFPDLKAGFHKNSKFVNWVLHNSYPAQSDLTVLATAAGVKGSLSAADAIAATQAAVWHFSDGASLDVSVHSAAITALYAYLTGGANVGLDQPTGNIQPPAGAQLSISPHTLPATTLTVGKDTLVGPFTVTTNFTDTSSFTITSQLPAGVKLTDKSGTAIDVAHIGSTPVYFDVPKGESTGSGTFTLSAPSTIGRLFVGSQGITQSLIVAWSSVSDKVTTSWKAGLPVPGGSGAGGPSASSSAPTSAPTSSVASSPTAASTTAAPVVANASNNLPYTGVSVIGPIALAVVLIGAGGAFLLIQRRRGRRA